jgi:hypothetical protein
VGERVPAVAQYVLQTVEFAPTNIDSVSQFHRIAIREREPSAQIFGVFAVTQNLNSQVPHGHCLGSRFNCSLFVWNSPQDLEFFWVYRQAELCSVIGQVAYHLGEIIK